VIIDQFSISLLTAIVVVVSGVLFIVETLLRRELAAARLWSVGYVGAMVTTLFYLAWAWQPATWWAVTAGNAAFVLGTGFMWLGCRRFNDHAIRWSTVAVLVGTAAAGIAAALEGPDGGDWAGGAWMFALLALFAGLSAAECFRGELGRTPTAAALGVVFGLESAFMLGRLVSFVLAGPESTVFRTWFGSFPASALTVVLMITAVVATSVLRAGRSSLRGTAGDAVADEPVFAVRSAASLATALGRVRERASHRGEIACIASVRLDDLDDIAAAFGADTRERLVQVWRRTLLDEDPSTTTPEMLARARTAAMRASSSVSATVLVAEVDA
jgi:hypothetical protein